MRVQQLSASFCSEPLRSRDVTCVMRGCSKHQPYVVSLFNQGDHMGKYHAEEALPRIRLGFLKMNERSKKNIGQQLAKIDRCVRQVVVAGGGTW